MDVSFQIKLIVGVVTLIGAIHADVNELNPLIPPPLSPNHGSFDVITLSSHGGNTGLSAFANNQGASASLSSSVGQKVNPVGCAPVFVGVPPNCRAEPYVPNTPKILLCPKGTYGEYPNCHEPCPGKVSSYCVLGSSE